MWVTIKQLEEHGVLHELINQRQVEIEKIKEHWKKKLTALEGGVFFQKFYSVLQNGTLVAAENGFGSTYFLLDQTQAPQFVIKPFDESILCLNNPRQYASPYHNLAFRVRDHIPLYRTAQTEALSSAFASILGLAHLTPETHLAVISHDQFFDISDHLDQVNQDQISPKLKKPDREKLCSIQTYISEIENVCQLANEWLEQNMSEDQILNLIDQTDFENLFLLLWLLYDTDAHSRNIYARPDAKGIYHLLKLDNGLTFPDKNGHLFNALALLPQARNKLSDSAIAKIQSLPIEKLIEQIVYFEMEDTLGAFLERVEILKQLASEKTHSLREIDSCLRKLGTTAPE